MEHISLVWLASFTASTPELSVGPDTAAPLTALQDSEGAQQTAGVTGSYASQRRPLCGGQRLPVPCFCVVSKPRLGFLKDYKI